MDFYLRALYRFQHLTLVLYVNIVYMVLIVQVSYRHRLVFIQRLLQQRRIDLNVVLRLERMFLFDIGVQFEEILTIIIIHVQTTGGVHFKILYPTILLALEIANTQISVR